MKATVVGFLLGLVGCIVAFPSMALEYTNRRGVSSFSETEKRQTTTTGWNAAAQYIDTTGIHAFVPPGPNDQRGPCPGLNSLANHGFIPHNGVGTIQQFIDATSSVYGMGTDMAAALTAYCVGVLGDGKEFSVGGPTSATSTVGLLSQPMGLSFSHNKFETDGSPTRSDLYLTGDANSLRMNLFNTLYATQDGVPDDQVNYDIAILNALRDQRITESKATNPYYFAAPFSGSIVQPAAYLFIFRFFANHTADYPEGILNRNVLKSFFAVSGDEGHFTWTPGNERIPDNWYRRAVGDEYTLLAISMDVHAGAAQYPQFNEIGGNTGTVNSFTGVDAANLSGGVYNAQSLLQGNNLACFGLQGAVMGAPDMLKGVVVDVTGTVNAISKAFAPAYSTLNCPQLTSYNTTLFSQFPGYTKLNAKGAYST